MDPQKTKPYFIEVYSSKDSSLLNKYKFVLPVGKVSELRDNVQEKLITKNQVKKEDKLLIKDNDDFELASDDEVEDVVPDGKIRVYLSSPKQPDNPQNNPPPPKVQQKDIQPQQPVQQVVQQPVQQPAQQNPSSQINKSGCAIDSTIIDLTNLVTPKISEECPKQKIMTIVCPQIRKTPFTIEGRDALTFLDFSNYVVKQFNLSLQLKALVYNHQGQALLFSLDLMNMRMPPLDYLKQYYIIFTKTKSVTDNYPSEPMFVDNSPVLLKIMKGKNAYNYQIDLDNSLSVLKHRIFKDTRIHPANQIIKFASNPLINDIETLKSYGLKDGSILQLSFKVISNIFPSTYTDKFYYKDVQLINPQEVQSERGFKSHILAFGYHLNELDKLKFTAFIRQYTNNNPLAYALAILFNRGFLSQAHRIALEEGFFGAIWQFMSSCQPTPKTQMKNLFDHTRDFLGYAFEGMKGTSSHEVQIRKREQIVKIQNLCTLTMKPITSPALIRLDNGKTVLVDRVEMEEQIGKGFTFTDLAKPVKENMFKVEDLEDNFDRFKANQEDNDQITTVFWLGQPIKPIEFNLPSAKGPAAQYQPNIIARYPDLKIHQALEIKSKSTIYLILKNKQHQFRIFVSKNKDITNPHNVFDVISGQEQAVNLDLMMAAGKTQNLQEAVDKNDLKPVITRQPKEAIIVLFDISGSMGSKFFNQADLKRIGAVKLFFEALAYRTIAYNFEHVVSLIFFDYQIEVQCDFTEAIYDFNRLVSQANPRGSTKLYDSIIKGVDQLVAFKKRYPECILRIMAMTDGEDTGSTQGMFEAAKAVICNNVVMDSFAVGTNCDGLKNITLATGGKCYLTRDMNESLKLFEQETVLSVRSRKIEPMFIGTSDEEIRKSLEKARFKPFDMGNDVHEFKMPDIKAPSVSAKELSKQYESEEGQKKLAGNSSLKRIMKEIQTYNKNPHPFVAIYPCSNINIWKILLLGPKETPYENGLFILYANFPGDYPFRAPQVRFITPIYHCNMNQQGRICHSVFDRNYSPALTFRQIIDCVYGLILTPEPDDPLDNVIASYYLSEYEKYYSNAVEATKKNASKTTVEIVEELFGKIADDIEKQKKVEEINKWVQTAKSFN